MGRKERWAGPISGPTDPPHAPARGQFAVGATKPLSRQTRQIRRIGRICGRGLQEFVHVCHGNGAQNGLIWARSKAIFEFQEFRPNLSCCIESARVLQELVTCVTK